MLAPKHQYVSKWLEFHLDPKLSKVFGGYAPISLYMAYASLDMMKELAHPQMLMAFAKTGC